MKSIHWPTLTPEEKAREPDRGMMTHMAECSKLTSLLIDLKKREMGLEYDRITMERLEDASKAVGRIQQCRQRGLFK